MAKRVRFQVNLVISLLVFCYLFVGCSNTQLKTFLPSNLFSCSNPKDFLTHDKYKSLTFEVIAVEGVQPSTGDFDFMINRITPYIDKPEGVTYVCDKLIPAIDVNPNKVWAKSDIKEFEAKYSKLESKDSNLIVHLIYLPGTYDNNTLAMQYSPESVVLFYNTFRYSNKTHMTVFHEACHCLGLVNSGAPSRHDHEDSEHEWHCKNKCILYWAVEGQQEELCQDCISDLLNYKESLK